MNAALSSKSSPMAARYKQLGHVNTTPPAEGYAHNRYARDHRDVGASPGLVPIRMATNQTLCTQHARS